MTTANVQDGPEVVAQNGFSFGRNWAQFISEHFSEQRVQAARDQLTGFMEMPSLAGKTMIDVGCGSGLHSLAAIDAGVSRLVSFDLDPLSVETTRRLRGMRGNPAHWTVMSGSVLDRDFLHTLEPADIVYSWGVLHHTGRMWQAIENAATLLKPGDSFFYVALYVTTAKSAYWTEVKKRYNSAPEFRKRAMELRYAVRYGILPEVVRGRNPIRFLRNYKLERGMDYMTDVRDWLGGYPYEDATIQEVLKFCRNLGLELVNLRPRVNFADYLFAPSRRCETMRDATLS